MSDGALSQDEIDALLAGVPSGSGAGGGGTAAPSGGAGGTDNISKTLETFLADTVGTQSSNLSTMTGAAVTVKAPQVHSVNREDFLQQLPDMVTAVKSDFNGGFPGEHVFLFSEDAAKALVALMNKEESAELDDMAMSVVGEAMNQVLGTQITVLTDKTGNKQIQSVSPEATNVPKAVVALPAGNFYSAVYQIDFGDGNSHQIWEVFGPAPAQGISNALGGGPTPAAAQSAGMGAMGFGGAMPAMGGGMMGGGGAMAGAPTNVQSVQFPNLIPQVTPQEQGNIGLIMDVYMEMTVELGRTRKLIKEILGMGEGTIIELDKLAGEPVDILVNHKLIAKGEVVVIDENFGVRVTEIVSTLDRIRDMG
jgi:flagellar motor switch protein FliN/FliY